MIHNFHKIKFHKLDLSDLVEREFIFKKSMLKENTSHTTAILAVLKFDQLDNLNKLWKMWSTIKMKLVGSELLNVNSNASNARDLNKFSKTPAH